MELPGGGFASQAINIGGSIGLTAFEASLQAEAAKDARDWQNLMSSTAYQRSMLDMKLAGLNPMLAYQQGGASTPPGAVARVPDLHKAAGTALAASRLGQEKKNMRATESKTKQEEKTSKKMEDKIGVEKLLLDLTLPEAEQTAKTFAGPAGPGLALGNAARTQTSTAFGFATAIKSFMEDAGFISHDREPRNQIMDTGTSSRKRYERNKK